VRTLTVRCSFTVEIEVPDEWDLDQARFAIEENGCPGTGIVGAKLEEIMEEHRKNSTCWACAAQGTNRIE
jgi:hypothetical protein